jgi:tetratricopeptide (TPR) repeat protein
MGNKLFALLTILVMAVSLIVGCQTVSKKTEPTTLEINPRIAEDYYNRGDAYRSKGQYDQAIADYNNALEMNPRYAEAYNNRGMVNMAKGQYDEAIADFNKALQINPMLALAYGNRGRAYYFKKEYDKSWDDINKVQTLGYQIPPGFLDDLRKASGRQK